jgi:hypothetical protein
MNKMTPPGQRGFPMREPLQAGSTARKCARNEPQLLTICLLLLLSPWTVTAQTNVAIPAAGEILKSLRVKHPRLLANADQFSALKERAANDAQLRGWYAQLRAEEVKIISEPPSKYEIPDGLRLLGTSRRVLHRMQTLGLVYQLKDHSHRNDRKRSSARAQRLSRKSETQRPMEQDTA